MEIEDTQSQGRHTVTGQETILGIVNNVVDLENMDAVVLGHLPQDQAPGAREDHEDRKVLGDQISREVIRGNAGLIAPLTNLAVNVTRLIMTLVGRKRGIQRVVMARQ